MRKISPCSSPGARSSQRRRDYLLPALRALGFDIPVTPDGAFYLYADCSRFTDDSFRFAQDLLEQAGVAITPGIDFGIHQPERHVRFAYTTSMEHLEEGVRRLQEYLQTSEFIRHCERSAAISYRDHQLHGDFAALALTVGAAA